MDQSKGGRVDITNSTGFSTVWLSARGLQVGRTGGFEMRTPTYLTDLHMRGYAHPKRAAHRKLDIVALLRLQMGFGDRFASVKYGSNTDMMADSTFWGIVAVSTLAGIVIYGHAAKGDSNWGAIGDLFDAVLVGGIAGFIGGIVLGLITSVVYGNFTGYFK